jgi:hypothetical protein
MMATNIWSDHPKAFPCEHIYYTRILIILYLNQRKNEEFALLWTKRN